MNVGAEKATILDIDGEVLELPSANCRLERVVRTTTYCDRFPTNRQKRYQAGDL